jgi:hypothetical protein
LRKINDAIYSIILDFTWRVSDGEELVGLLTGDDGVGFGIKISV